MNTHLPILLTAITLTSSCGYAQSAYEISADGHHLAPINQYEPTHSHTTRRGVGAVPFLLVPDQTVELRRQIGGLKIADIDNDGHNDLVAVCYQSNSFPPYKDWHDMIFFGDGAGINTAPGWISDLQTHTGDVQVGDIDNNGYQDIVTIHGGLRRDSVRVYFGSASGTPTAPGYTSNTLNSTWATAGVLADMDQDNDLDLVTTNQGVSPNPNRPILMFDNTGSTLTTASTWQSSDESIQNGIAAQDITGDGYPDLAVAKWVNHDSGLYLNTTGTPETTQSATASKSDTDKGVAFTDLQGDGTIDIAFGGDPTRVYEWTEDTLNPVYASNPPFAGPQEIMFIDVDQDGDDDLAEIHFSDGRAHIYLNRDGTLDTKPTWTFDASEVGTAMAFGDLNGDSRPDLALGYSGNTCIRIFFAQAPACPADLTNDGELDFFDVSAFLDAFAAQEPAADYTSDGEYDFFDVSAFLDHFAVGCP